MVLDFTVALDVPWSWRIYPSWWICAPPHLIIRISKSAKLIHIKINVYCLTVKDLSHLTFCPFHNKTIRLSLYQ